MDITFFLERFSPTEAERISGVSTVMQRHYRRGGFLPSNGGRGARFDLFDLAKLIFIQAVHKRELGTAAGPLGPWVASGTAFRILELEAAYAPTWLLESADLSVVAAEALRQHSPLGPEKTALYLGRYFVAWANDDPGFYEQLDADLFEKEAATNPARVVGAPIFYDMQAAAAQIVTRAERPLIRVSQAVDLATAPRKVLVS